MANEQNLMPNSERTPKELREMARNGGLASGEARRIRKTLKEELLLLLSDGDTQKSVTLALIAKAMDGDTRAFEIIRDTIGEKPVDKVESKQTVLDMSKFSTEELKAMLDNDITGRDSM